MLVTYTGAETETWCQGSTAAPLIKRSVHVNLINLFNSGQLEVFYLRSGGFLTYFSGNPMSRSDLPGLILTINVPANCPFLLTFQTEETGT